MTTHSDEWLAGYARAKEQAVAVAKLYTDELVSEQIDIVQNMRTTSEQELLEDAFEVGGRLREAGDTAARIGRAIEGMLPPGADVTIDEIAKGFRTKGDEP